MNTQGRVISDYINIYSCTKIIVIIVIFLVNNSIASKVFFCKQQSTIKWPATEGGA